MSALAPARLGLRMAPNIRAVALELAEPQATLAALADFHADELSSAAVPKRRAEYLAGRYAAELALSELGFGAPATHARVGRNSDRSPAWPSGVVGSISHGAGIAVAAVARSEHYLSLGIDIERIPSDGELAELSPVVANDAEHRLLAQALPDLAERERVAVCFSCKESAFKCLFPLLRTILEFSDVRFLSVDAHAKEHGSIELEFVREGESVPGGKRLRATYFVSEPRVESAACFSEGA